MFRIVRVLIIFTACLLGVGAVPVLQAQGLSGYVHTVPGRFFSVSHKQELIFCCGAEIVPKRSQCKQKPYPLCNLQRSLLI